MPSPTSNKQVQSFIGMINYISKFSPRLSDLAEPIRELLKDKVPFNWGPEHQQAFTEMKKEVSSVPVLTYYNPKKQRVLQTEASIKGLGACLLQEDKPVSTKYVTIFVCIHVRKYCKLLKQSKFINFFLTSFCWPSCYGCFIRSERNVNNNPQLLIPGGGHMYIYW